MEFTPTAESWPQYHIIYVLSGHLPSPCLLTLYQLTAYAKEYQDVGMQRIITCVGGSIKNGTLCCSTKIQPFKSFCFVKILIGSVCGLRMDCSLSCKYGQSLNYVIQAPQHKHHAYPLPGSPCRKLSPFEAHKVVLHGLNGRFQPTFSVLRAIVSLKLTLPFRYFKNVSSETYRNL